MKKFEERISHDTALLAEIDAVFKLAPPQIINYLGGVADRYQKETQIPMPLFVKDLGIARRAASSVDPLVQLEAAHIFDIMKKKHPSIMKMLAPEPSAPSGHAPRGSLRCGLD